MGEMLFVLANQAQPSWPGSSNHTAMPAPYKSATEGDGEVAQPRPVEKSPRTVASTVELLEPSLAQEDEHQTTVGQLDSKQPIAVSLSPVDMQPEETQTQTDIQPNTKQLQQETLLPAPSPSPSPSLSRTASQLLCLPLEVRLQIYQWVLLLGDGSGAASATSTPTNTMAGDTALSVSSTLFHCMPPYYFDSPQHFGPGDGIMFPPNVFGTKAHQRPLQFRRVTVEGKQVEDKEEKKEAAEDKEDKKDKKETQKTKKVEAMGQGLLPAHRPIGRALPVGLLASCRQVYGEARTLAFETSEFVFVRLFSSGLSTAHAFVVLGSKTLNGSHPRLQPWQGASLRHARLELDVSVADMGWTGRGRDPKHVGKKRRSSSSINETKMETGVVGAGIETETKGGTDEEEEERGPKILDRVKWEAVCDGLAKGLHGMRLLLNITEERTTIEGGQDSGDESDEGTTEDDTDETQRQEEAAAARSALVHGLARLAALRQLEIELVWVLRGRFRSRSANMTPADRAANVTWCAAVEKAINAERRLQQQSVEPPAPSGSRRRPVSAKVVCVERIYDEEVKG